MQLAKVEYLLSPMPLAAGFVIIIIKMAYTVMGYGLSFNNLWVLMPFYGNVLIFLCPRRCLISGLMINEQIRDKEVRLIDEDGTQMGIVTNKAAQDLAMEKRLDLVKISPTAKPPVCKIMDYSKHRFDQQKREKEARKKQKTVSMKEIRLSPNIDKHDIDVKIKKAKEFLQNGDKVKVSIRFRGREMGYADNAVKIFADFAKSVEEYGAIDRPPKREARTMSMFLNPHKTQ